MSYFDFGDTSGTSRADSTRAFPDGMTAYSPRGLLSGWYWSARLRDGAPYYEPLVGPFPTEDAAIADARQWKRGRGRWRSRGRP